MKAWLKWTLGIILLLIIIFFLIGPSFIKKYFFTKTSDSIEIIEDSLKREIEALYANKTIIGKEGGACVFIDDSNKTKTCKLTISEDCSATFNKGLLCSAEELGTECSPSTSHYIIQEKDYFIDTCGNQANPYNEFQIKNKSYWTNII